MHKVTRVLTTQAMNCSQLLLWPLLSPSCLSELFTSTRISLSITNPLSDVVVVRRLSTSTIPSFASPFPFFVTISKSPCSVRSKLHGPPRPLSLLRWLPGQTGSPRFEPELSLLAPLLSLACDHSLLPMTRNNGRRVASEPAVMARPHSMVDQMAMLTVASGEEKSR